MCCWWWWAWYRFEKIWVWKNVLLMAGRMTEILASESIKKHWPVQASLAKIRWESRAAKGLVETTNAIRFFWTYYTTQLSSLVISLPPSQLVVSIRIQDMCGKWIACWALIDTVSQVSALTQNCKTLLVLTRRQSRSPDFHKHQFHVLKKWWRVSSRRVPQLLWNMHVNLLYWAKLLVLYHLINLIHAFDRNIQPWWSLTRFWIVQSTSIPC